MSEVHRLQSGTATLAPLTSKEKRAWAQDGFFVREAVFSGTELERLRAGAEAAAARAAQQVRSDPLARTYHLDGKRFVDVGPRTVQFEHQAGSEDVKVIEPVQDLDPVLSALVEDPRLTGPMRALLGADALSLWTDKLNLKRPGVGSGFGWHQDAPYWAHDHPQPTALPNVMVTFDDADADNGCFAAIRASHLEGCLPGTDDGTQLGGFYTDPARYELADAVRFEVPAGSLVFFHPSVVHGSEPNRSARARRAMVITYQAGHAPALKTRSLRAIPSAR